MSLPLYSIRDANELDIPALTELINELGYPTTVDELTLRFNHIGQHPDYRTLVITVGQTVAGMAGLLKSYWYEKNGMYVRVLAFVVANSHRKKGLGKLLMDAVETWAKAIDANAIILTSGNRDERKPAHLFYQSLGYQIKSSGFVKNLAGN
jgi:GNAT superfamily N-acetyltransferase